MFPVYLLLVQLGVQHKPEGSFLSSILLLVVIIVAVVIVVVMVILVFVVVSIIVIVFVVGGVSSIIKLSFMIIGSLHRTANEFHHDKASSVRVPVANFTLLSSVQLLWENTDSVHFLATGVPLCLVFLLVSSVFVMVAACASRVTATLLATSGKISSEKKKSRGSNSRDGGNTRDEGKTGGGVIGSCGSGIGEIVSEAERSLDESYKGSEEVFPRKVGEFKKDHPLKQIIRDIHSAPQTRRMTQNVTEHVEPKKVWTLMDLPPWKRARLMDVKSEFLNSKTKEEVYVCQPIGFEDPEFLDKVYKRGQIDKTLFIKRVKGDILLVPGYVDDIFLDLLRRKAKWPTEISQSSGPIPLIADETVIKEWEDIIKRAVTTASSLEVEQDSGGGGAKAQIRFEAASKQSNDPPLLRVNTLGSGEDNMKLKELMEFCTKVSVRALDL
ncbi:hypothetical protein Tco_1102157 [Tanacetum coccineum]